MLEHDPFSGISQKLKNKFRKAMRFQSTSRLTFLFSCMPNRERTARSLISWYIQLITSITIFIENNILLVSETHQYLWKCLNEKNNYLGDFQNCQSHLIWKKRITLHPIYTSQKSTTMFQLDEAISDESKIDEIELNCLGF